jgi:hypothetical protein
VQEIRVNVPAPKIVIRKEKKAPEAPPPAAPPPVQPSNEVLLVPRVVYVPFTQQTPTGPARMVPLTTAPAPPPLIVPPAAPPPAAPCANPVAAAPPAVPAPEVENLKRRCAELEQKCERLIQALENRSPQTGTEATGR